MSNHRVPQDLGVDATAGEHDRPCDQPPLSALAAAHPEIVEMEINPLLVTGDGAIGLVARIVRADT